jgi:hypothetical protein
LPELRFDRVEDVCERGAIQAVAREEPLGPWVLVGKRLLSLNHLRVKKLKTGKTGEG